MMSADGKMRITDVADTFRTYIKYACGGFNNRNIKKEKSERD